MGGQVERPTYEQVCGGRTGHAEVVRVRFDPTRSVTAICWNASSTCTTPLPSTARATNVGTQYRSAIFWHSPEQRAEAEGLIADLTGAPLPGPHRHPGSRSRPFLAAEA